VIAELVPVCRINHWIDDCDFMHRGMQDILCDIMFYYALLLDLIYYE